MSVQLEDAGEIVTTALRDGARRHDVIATSSTVYDND